jgi:hypothetical protein
VSYENLKNGPINGWHWNANETLALVFLHVLGHNSGIDHLDTSYGPNIMNSLKYIDYKAFNLQQIFNGDNTLWKNGILKRFGK